MKETFEGFDYTAEEVYGAINADVYELHCPLELIMATQIDADVARGDLKVKDIPERWKHDEKEIMLGSIMEGDPSSCLQNVVRKKTGHWYLFVLVSFIY